MKLNWGHGVTVVMIAFIGLMTSFMVRAYHNQEELVAEDYYKQELRYQDRIDRMGNAAMVGEAVRTEVVPGSLTIVFPAVFQDETITGTVHLLKPNDGRADRTEELRVDSNGRCVLDTRDWMKGAYHVEIEWIAGRVEHLTETHIDIR